MQSLLEDTYVDDIQGGGDTEEDAVRFKREATKILSEGGFTLHKWHAYPNCTGLDFFLVGLPYDIIVRYYQITAEIE